VGFEMNIKRFVKDSLGDMTNEELIKRYSLKSRKEISLILNSKEGQTEIKKQQKPLTEKQTNNLKGMSEELNKCVGLLK